MSTAVCRSAAAHTRQKLTCPGKAFVIRRAIEYIDGKSSVNPVQIVNYAAMPEIGIGIGIGIEKMVSGHEKLDAYRLASVYVTWVFEKIRESTKNDPDPDSDIDPDSTWTSEVH